ncbi:hypothetical protein RclHR1_00930006 [Rhizophagus clarus]|uniref:F-box domain-containing protein n=1 Tax=Rhizophagus clarus TaxID=94130 RepID=A0A2Z6S3R0_9GLOM|nr:hypothetical protein RclHR1_00930006 [Rhizophagus clarus]GES91153.1 hypothetical protein GLOIN_2v1784405 [Rhizophagus clarus]
MVYRLPADCISEIIEYLEEDKYTLYSCLLANRLWCEISVKVLWRNVWSFYQQRPLRVALSILSTLIACLPSESKELFHKNQILIPTPTSKSPLFNYAAFCKVLLTHKIIRLVDDFFKGSLSVNSLSLKNRKDLVVNEIIKMFAKQIYSLRKMTYYCSNINFTFAHFPGVQDLTELCCSSNLPSNFFHQLSKICQNLQSISIEFSNDVSNGLIELISLQNNLRSLSLIAFDLNWENIIPVLTTHSNMITKLHLYSGVVSSPLSFVKSFSKLQEIIFTFYEETDYEDFTKLEYIKFPELQILKFPTLCPKSDHVIKFLENNGTNLKNFYTSESDNALRLSIAKYCPNLKNLFIVFKNGELNILKSIFSNCQNLESIKIQCGKWYLAEKDVLETIATYSLNSFYKLKLYNVNRRSDLSPGDLESFFINWRNRTSKKLLEFIVIKNENYIHLDECEENMKIIKKYENLGIIKLVIKMLCDEEKDEEEEYYYYYC